ncbi:hypothetical protein GGH13_001920 [Coemansia sp. S155-1]|nr:hypothetical protein GGH13_001920 [Coemansia sp. S155-1]
MSSTTLLMDREAQDNPFQPLLQESTPSASTEPSTLLYNPVAFNVLLLLNALSVLCSLGSVLLLVCLRYQRGRVYRWQTQPVSIRLILYAAIIDIFYSAFRVYDMAISQSDTRADSQANCQAAMFGVTFFALLSVFVRALFSAHLHAVVVHKLNKPLSYERRFIIGSFVLALSLALLPLTRSSYAWIEYDPTLGSGHCSYFSLNSLPRGLKMSEYSADEARQAVISGVLWCWATYFGWLALTIAYSTLVIGAVIYQLYVERRRTMQLTAHRYNQLLDSYPIKQEEMPDHSSLVFIRSLDGLEVWRLARQVLRRVAQFPATIIVCHSLEVAWATATLVCIIPLVRRDAAGRNSHSDLKILYVAMQVMLALQGIITLLSLCLEPAVKALLAEWWRIWRNHKQRKVEVGEAIPEITQSRLGASGRVVSLEAMPWDIVVYRAPTETSQ